MPQPVFPLPFSAGAVLHAHSLDVVHGIFIYPTRSNVFLKRAVQCAQHGPTWPNTATLRNPHPLNSCSAFRSPSDLCLHDKNYFLAPPSVWSRRACAERSGKRDHWHGPSRPFIGEPPEHLAWIFGAIFTSFDQLSAADIKQLVFVVRFSACAPWNGKVSSADFR